MEIQECKYQYMKPERNYNNDTRGNKYKLQQEWHKYYYAEFIKNYFIEDELEFLKALKSDLQQELEKTDKDIKRLEKTR